MIIVQDTDESEWARWQREEIKRCPGHVWSLMGKWSPIWSCERCPAEGRIR